MATLISIKQGIEQLDSGTFQCLCDEYLSREGYPNLIALGTKAGTQKTTRGTPDTYFCKIDGKYVFAEYTIQKTGLKEKIRSDLEKCFDTHFTGIDNKDIAEIIYCHTSSNIHVGTDKALKQYCEEKGTQLTLIGIDKLADDIYRRYPTIAKDYLRLVIDTEQIQEPCDFIKQYDANALAAPLNTKFLFRENELEKLQQAFAVKDIVILSGAAGTGKTRLALEFAQRFQKKYQAKLYVIHDHGLPIYEDLKLYFEQPGSYFIVIDDANQLSQLNLIVEYVNKKEDGFNIKILITVRNYAYEKVKSDVRDITDYADVVLDSISDDQIETLVKNYWDIHNPDNLTRIITIADGNARIAMLAGKIASKTNQLESIRDVTELYDAYYGKALREVNLEKNLELQITAGVIAFLGSIHLEHMGPVLAILNEYHLDLLSFKNHIYEFHKMELVDICRDKAVAISDQCFANFILKYVFVDKKTLSLARMLDVCFETYRERTILAVNTLIGVFQNQEIVDFIVREVQVIWKKRKNESESCYWEWVKAFYQTNQEETLLLIEEKIDRIEKVTISIDEIDTNSGKNIESVNDDLINILGGFADTQNVDAALDLFFEYYLKRPDLYIQFYHAVTLYFGIIKSSIKTGFFTPIRLIEHFIQYSDHWNNLFVIVLFLESAKTLLQVYFSPSEADRHGHGFTIYRFSLPSTEQAIVYRKLIWEQLLIIQSKYDSKEYIRAILQNYAKDMKESSYELVKKDAPYICKLFQIAFSSNMLNDCILAEYVDSRLCLAGYHSESMNAFLHNRKLNIYHLLVSPPYSFGKSDDERENEKTKIITDFLSQAPNCLNAFDELFEVYREYTSGNDQYLYEVGSGLMKAIQYFLQDRHQFIKIAKKIIKSGVSQEISEIYITSTLFTFLSPEEVKEMIQYAPKETIDFWLYSYFHELPPDNIDRAKVENLYTYFKCDYDRNIHRSSFRNLKFLGKYETIDPDVVVKVSTLIFAKKEYSPFIVNLYFSHFFNRYVYEPNNILQKFIGAHRLLEQIYLFESRYGQGVDFDGAFLKELCIYRKEFAKEYVNMLLSKNGNSLYDIISEKFQAIYACSNFIDIIDLMVDESFHTTYSRFKTLELIKAFLIVPETIVSKSDTWVRHYISNNNSNAKKMNYIFDVISQLPDDRKIEYIHYLITLNDDLELFRKIPLWPTSYSHWGSQVPLYSKRIDYLKKLLPFFSGIRFLKHKKAINEQINYLIKMKEKAEIQELLRG